MTRWMASERPNRPRTNPKQILAKQLRRRSGYGTVRGNESDSRAARRNNNEQTRNQRMGSYNVPLNPFLLPIINVPNRTRQTSPRKNTPAPNKSLLSNNNAVLVLQAPKSRPRPVKNTKGRNVPSNRNAVEHLQLGITPANMLSNNFLLLSVSPKKSSPRRSPKKSPKKQSSPKRIPANWFHNL